MTSAPVRTELLPADPAALDALPARLHRLATEAGHEKLAYGLTHLFGRAVCPDCEAVCSVSDRVVETYQ
ncbi:hypothetical protein [Streptomyces sp. NRRL S-378]|uniref:hypothetical protein n=1 Tax=Streptomyces sp. NRRL S-378 TaxID=1463904 RepID=UPI0004C7B2F8|nr:hypothetical protein [Streptomyces sp. NRRL S-378]